MKIAVIFPGYGSQHVGMGKDVYDEYRIVQEYFEEASNCLNTNFVKLCFASSETEMATMPIAYTSIFLVSSSLYALLKQEGIVPSLVAGYNIGEYSALFAANSITFPDGLYLLNKLALFYQEALSSLDVQMIRVMHVDGKKLEAMCEHASRGDERAQIVSSATSNDFIISGSTHAVEYVWRRVKDEGGQATVHEVPVAFGLHSPMMESVGRNLKIYLEKVDFKDVAVPIVSGMDGSIVISGEDIKRRIIDQITAPIQFQRALQTLHDYDLLIAVGPGTEIFQMLQAYYPEKKCVVMNKKNDIETIKNIIQTASVEIYDDRIKS